jgi:hypothetical protein
MHGSEGPFRVGWGVSDEQDHLALSSGQVVALTGFGKDKALRVLKELAAKGLIRIQDSGRGTRHVMG